jgi:transposase InsO family protein
MPWAEVSTMSLRYEFVMLSLQPDANMSQLCRSFEISRKTGYKWRSRFAAAKDPQALADRSRRPHRSPTCTAAQMQAAVLQMRRQRRWGGRKIQCRLKNLGYSQVPAPSTISGILKRHGLIDPKESARRELPQRFERERPNELWQMDFKGHIALRSGRCHPLTVLDDHSRYSIALRACSDERCSTVQRELTRVFRRYGLPEQMLMDNGSPWSAHTAQVLTGFSIWLIQLGIRINHGRPFHPQTQGKDERFHRSLDVEVIQRQALHDLAHCQREFDRWRNIYNLERPHESLNMQVPAQRYRPSERNFPERLPDIEYAPHDQVRKVQAQGELSFQGHTFRICKALRGYPVALRPTTMDGQWQVFFCHQHVATIDLHEPYE